MLLTKPPVAPASLAPVEMSVLDSADTSGAHTPPRRPLSIRTGVGIVLTGIFIGGAFGIFHRATSPKVRVGVTSVAAVATPQVKAAAPVIEVEPSPPAAPKSITLEAPFVIASEAPLKRARSVAKTKGASAQVAKPKETKPLQVKEAKSSKETAASPAKAERAPNRDDSERALKAAMGATENAL
jgi:hypothetical protein